MKLSRIFLILPPVLAAVAGTVWLVSNAEPPARVEQAEMEVTARTMVAEPRALQLTARGYGSVRPAWSWQAVAEVAGAITFRHPDLETGNIIAGGTTVLEIDTEPYEIALRQARADLAALAAEREQIALEQGNTAGLLEIERERLALGQRDLERVRALVERGAAPQSRLDELERNTLQMRRVVQELENALSLTETRVARVAAQIARAEAAVDRAGRDLRLTRVTVPRDMRVGAVQVELHEFTQPGKPLVQGDGIDRAEVTAQIPIAEFARLMGEVTGDSDLAHAAQIPALEEISAELRLVTVPGQVWEGRVIRIENALDPVARSVPVVIAVDAPYEGAAPPKHLPLVPNMYVEVLLSAQSDTPRIALPASAVQGERVYLRDADGRLELREISRAWQQEGLVVIEDGLEAGEEVVLDDISPAIPGLRILPLETGK